MLSLKILQGIESQVIALKDGVNTVGRQKECDILLNSHGVSKMHAQLIVKDNICSVTDLGSSNGTFVNGVKVQDRILKIGDTIAFHNVLVQLIQDTGHGFAEMSPGIASEPHSQNPTSNFSLENLLMPPLYKLNEFYPTKNLIAALMIIFALVVTFLSTVPMTELMKASIQKEASRRALSIARQLADASERALAMGSESTVRTDFAESEDGVIGALVVAKEDGHIIAPLSKAQSYSNDEFVARARKHDEIFIDKNSSASIGVSVPVRMYSPETGQQLIVAYAVVSYKLNALDWGAVVGLFARVLILSLILAYVFYAMIYHLVTYPLRTTSQQLDKVLRGEASTINSNFEFGTFKRLVNDINSALARIQPHQDMLALNPSFDTSVEGANLIRILKDAAICLSKEGKIISVNQAFEDLTNQRLATLEQQNLSAVQDQALQLSIDDLLQKSISLPSSVATRELDISGLLYEMDSQAISNGKDVMFVIVTIKLRTAA